MADISANATDLEFDDEHVETHAAYVLGRNIWMIDGWLESVHSIAQHPERPWEWSETQRLFGESYDVPPFDWNDGISDALLTLVEARVVDAGILVELHRELDATISQSELIADLIHNDRQGAVCENLSEAAAHSARAVALAESLLTYGKEPCGTWHKFGAHLGRLLNFLGREFDVADCVELCDRLIDLGQGLLSFADMNEIVRVRDSATTAKTVSESRQINVKSIDALKRLDQVAIRMLRSEIVVQDPYVVLDDIREEINFLGNTIPFQTFQRKNATGGINILRTLMHSPGEFLLPQKLIDQSELGIDISQLGSYVSRFRAVIVSTEVHWPARFRSGENRRRAKSAFIVHKHKRRKRFETKSDIEGTEYKLDLQPSQVSHIS